MPRGAKGAKPAKAKVEATLLVARTSRKNEGSRTRQLEKRLAEALKREAEALEQQTATADILRVISSSPTDAQPVFEAIVQSAGRLLDGAWSALIHVKDGALHVGAHRLEGMRADAVRESLESWPRPLDDDNRAALGRRKR